MSAVRSCVRQPDCQTAAECVRQPVCDVIPNAPKAVVFGMTAALNETSRCWVCRVPAVLTIIGTDRQWFTCITHHGTVAYRLLNGEAL